jgi:hypothetical protein
VTDGVPWEERDIVVFCDVATTRETCDLGEEHEVQIVSRKVLGPVYGTASYNNGYEVMDTHLRRDRQGRSYHQHIQIDFFNNISWWREDDVRFKPHLGSGVVREFQTNRRLK